LNALNNKMAGITYEQEIERLNNMRIYENKAYNDGFTYIGGIDEAGRGPLAGPVAAACVILPKDIVIEGLNDSKKLSPRKREKLFIEITEKAVSYGIGFVDEQCIDRINILNATKKAIKNAVESMGVKPDILLVDALKLEDIEIPQVSLIKGDSKSVSIAAASILAKVSRDRLMDELDNVHPQYGFIRHKGYGTTEHIEAIKKYGLCPIHRLSFTKKITGQG
jgi:ribonuclease HII